MCSYIPKWGGLAGEGSGEGSGGARGGVRGGCPGEYRGIKCSGPITCNFPYTLL